MPRITMDDGIGLYVEAAPDNGKPPLLFLNALGADHTMWDDQMPLFSEHFRVVRFDDRGHGQSEIPDMPYTIDRLGRDARGVLEAFDIDSAHIVGMSKGGMTAAWLGANSPEHVEKLVISSSAPHLAPRDVWEGRANTARNEGVEALAEMDLRDDLELIPVPTLVICGDSDPGVQPGKTREWVATIEGARLEVIRKAAHLPNIEQADAFNQLVLEFLKA